MIDKIFKRKKQFVQEQIYAPLSGELIPLENVPDPVFAGKMMGEGVAIIPEEGMLVSPVEGEIIQVFHTKHAIGIRSISGLEILIHIGLETVELNGEGFDVRIAKGQKVKVGDPLVNFDISFLKSKNKEIITPIIITNYSDKVDGIVQVKNGVISKEDMLFMCNIK